MEPTPDVDGLVEIIAAYRYRHANEKQLQAAIAAALVARGVPVEREARLNPGDVIDMLIGRIGVEVKVDGSPSEVTRQLRRYATSPDVDALILVTTRPSHTSLPAWIDGVPVRVLALLSEGIR